MNAELISVGTELLMGQIVNTNARDLSIWLSELGINLYYQTVVGDNPLRLEKTMRDALSRSDLVIVTGGLGPTGDDLTKETAAKLMGMTLALDEDSLLAIEAYYKKVGRPMAPCNRKQAMMPVGGIIIPNPVGTAPGCIMEQDGKSMILLPGPPNEMTRLFEDTVRPYLEGKSGGKLYSRILHVFGIGESSVEEELKDLMQGEEVTVAPYAKLGEVHLRVTTRCTNDEEGEKKLRPVIEEIEKRLGDTVYTESDQSIAGAVLELLKKKKMTLATAESCTGGMIGEALTEIPGASEVYLGGAVTYSNALKEKMLGVPKETLDTVGAVSYETAKAMSEGIRKETGADIGVSVTGIAGPDGGTAQKPVGLVYVSVSTGEKTWVKELHLSGSRHRIRQFTLLHALDEVRKYLL